MKFSEYLWRKIHPFFQEIIKHPFHMELSKGSLSEERFQFFIHQDILYLQELSEVFRLVAKKANTSELNHHFHHLSTDALARGEQLRSLYLNYSQVSQDIISPTCKLYTHYLKAMAKKSPFEVALAAFLPCFWIFNELSRYLTKIVTKDNPYFAWIQLNLGEENEALTDHLISNIDQHATSCSAKHLNLMEEVVEQCSQFEWDFWNDAYHLKIR